MMLNPKPESRIPMEEIFKHPWLLDQEVTKFEPHPFPNTPSKDSINMDIVNHIVHQMRLEKTSEVSTCQEDICIHVTMVTIQ